MFSWWRCSGVWRSYLRDGCRWIPVRLPRAGSAMCRRINKLFFLERIFQMSLRGSLTVLDMTHWHTLWRTLYYIQHVTVWPHKCSYGFEKWSDASEQPWRYLFIIYNDISFCYFYLELIGFTYVWQHLFVLFCLWCYTQRILYNPTVWIKQQL